MLTTNRLCFGAAFCLIIACLISCNSCKTQPNRNDTTPPTIDWTIDNVNTGQKTEIKGTGTVNLKYNDEVVITACVEDDGGVQQISSWSNSSYRCRRGELVQQVGPGLVSTETSPLGLDENGLAWKRYCKLYRVKFNYGCSDGFEFESGSSAYYLEGKNFANLSANGILTIAVTR